jgi:hypothetical protein
MAANTRGHSSLELWSEGIYTSSVRQVSLCYILVIRLVGDSSMCNKSHKAVQNLHHSAFPNAPHAICSRQMIRPCAVSFFPVRQPTYWQLSWRLQGNTRSPKRCHSWPLFQPRNSFIVVRNLPLKPPVLTVPMTSFLSDIQVCGSGKCSDPTRHSEALGVYGNFFPKFRLKYW